MQDGRALPSSPTVPGKFRKAEQHGWGEFEYHDRLHFFGGLVIHGLGTKSNVRRVSREKSACCSVARKSPGPARCEAAPLLARGPRSPTAEPHRVRVAPGGPVAREPFRPPGRRWRSAVVSGRAVRQAACGVPGPRAAPLRGRVWVRAPTSPSPSSKQQRPRLLRPPRGTRAGEGGGERRASAGSPGGGGQGRRPRPWRSLTRPAPVGSPGLTQKHLLGALVRGSLGGDEPLARGSEGSGRVPRCFNRRAVLESALNCADQVGTGFPTIPNQKCRRQRQPRRPGSALGRGPRGHGRAPRGGGGAGRVGGARVPLPRPRRLGLLIFVSLSYSLVVQSFCPLEGTQRHSAFVIVHKIQELRTTMSHDTECENKTLMN